MRKKRNKKWFICTVMAISVLVLISCSKSFQINLGGQKIEEEEFLAVMGEQQYGISQYFSETYGTGTSKDFWSQKFGEEIPYQKLAEETVDKLKEIHAAYELGVEIGYVDSASFASFEKRWKNENKNRKEKIEKGETVYGLAEYTMELFREYEMDTLQKQYCGDPENEGMKISGEEAQAYYEENKNRMFLAYDDVELNYVRIYYEAEEASDEQVNAYREAVSRLHEGVRQGGDMKELAKQDMLLANYFWNKTVTSGEYGSQSRDIWDVLELSQELKEGECTQVLDENGCLYLIQCMKRMEHDYQAFEEVRQVIEKDLKEKRYNEILQKRADKLELEGDMEKVYDFTKEHVEK